MEEATRVCSKCQRVLPLNSDYVKPLSKGGRHLLANLRPACANCNDRKKARWPYVEILTWRGPA